LLFWVLAILTAVAVPARGAEAPPDPGSALEQLATQAEIDLKNSELDLAESRYRSVLLEGWLVLGSLDGVQGNLAEARTAFQRAESASHEVRRARRALAAVHLQLGETGEAVRLLTMISAMDRKDMAARRLLAQALVAHGKSEQAVQELEEARLLAPDDLELLFSLASGYLSLGGTKAAAADPLFDRILKARPIPQSYVLIGRTYRDHRRYERARTLLRKALELDPRVRRAHYYLGSVAALEDSATKLDEAIHEFREELKLAPEDILSNLYLGMALAEKRACPEAIPHLERAAGVEPPDILGLYYLGRCRLSTDRPQDAVGALRRALELSKTRPPDESRLGRIHYQLAVALRRSGDEAAATVHFKESESTSASATEKERERLSHYLAGTLAEEQRAAAMPLDSPLAALPPEQREVLRTRVTTVLTRAYMNLGIIHAQARRFARAASFLEEAAALDPDFPQIQYSLGTTHFSAGQYEKAIPALLLARQSAPADANVGRLLALSYFNSEQYEKTANLLRNDRARATDASLQYVYGVALVRSGNAVEAEQTFSRLLTVHRDQPELLVVLGQAHAQQGDFAKAETTLKRALELKADVLEAQGTLGVIYLKQGKLPEAEAALRAEIKARSDDVNARHHLAVVLDLQSRPQDAAAELRTVLKARPNFADARYLLGKVLLAQGAAAEASQHLESAVRLAPNKAPAHFQLSQAYQKLGEREKAAAALATYQSLKEKQREDAP
jgi:tetratricopeptide (TPR) repeat protein